MAVMYSVTPALKTTSIQETIDFYVGSLGFTVDTVWPEAAPTFCILDNGDLHLMFYDDDANDDSEPKLTGQLFIDTDGVDAFHSEISGKVAVEWGPEVYHYGRREFAILDNNGYTLVFSEPTEDPPTQQEH